MKLVKFLKDSHSKKNHQLSVKWKKNLKGWGMNPPDSLKNREDFNSCPYCKEKKMSHTVLIDDEKDYEVCTEDWACLICGKKINYIDLSQETRDFIENHYCRDISDIFKHPIIIKYKIKSGSTKQLGTTELSIAFKNNDTKVVFRCGNCNKKGKFRNLDQDNIYQCLKCGYPNKIDIVN